MFKRINKNIFNSTCLFFGIILSFNLPVKSFAQCSGGTFVASITPTTVFQITTDVAGAYHTFSATIGVTYVFTFCRGGGSATFDTQITILDNAGAYAPGLTGTGYSDDNCGLQSELFWVAPSTATYRVLINEFDCNSNLTTSDLSYRIAPPVNDTCGGAITVAQDGTCISGTTVNANSNWANPAPGCMLNNDNEVWYKFVADSGIVDIGVTGTGIGDNIEIVLVKGNGPDFCNNSFTIATTSCGPSPLNLNYQSLQKDSTYYFTISSTTTDGTFDVCVTGSNNPCTQGGTSACGGIVVGEGCNGCYDNTGNPGGANASPPCYGSANNDPIWFKFVPDSDAVNVVINQITQTGTFFIRGWVGANCSSISKIGNFCLNSGDTARFYSLTPGDTLWLEMDNDAAPGSFNICIEQFGAIDPPGVDC